VLDLYRKIQALHYHNLANLVSSYVDVTYFAKEYLGKHLYRPLRLDGSRYWLLTAQVSAEQVSTGEWLKETYLIIKVARDTCTFHLAYCIYLGRYSIN
jgi:hypothetical protein